MRIIDTIPILVPYLKCIPEKNWSDRDKLEVLIRTYSDFVGISFSDFVKVIGISLNGKYPFPPPFDMMSVLSKDETLCRLQHVYEKLKNEFI